jgi:hypothetical protein
MSMVDILQKEFMSSELYRINKIKILYEKYSYLVI